MRMLIVVAALAIPLTARADPNIESQQFLRVAFGACQEAISYNKIDVDLYKKWMENRAKAVRADPSIRAWSGKLDGQQVNTRFEQCEALFKKALDEAEKTDAATAAKAAADKRDPVVVGPYAERALGDCFVAEKAVDAARRSRWEYEQEMLADRRKRLYKDYPDADKLATQKAYGTVAAGAKWAEVFAACEAYLKSGLEKAKAGEAKQAAADKAARAQVDADAAARDKKWMGTLKGDRLRVYATKRNHTMPTVGDATSAMWRYTIYNGTGTCEVTYAFKGNTLTATNHQGACNQVAM